MKTFQEYEDYVYCNNLPEDRTATFLHLLEEVGEVTKIFSKAIRRGGDYLTLEEQQEMLYELGDTLALLTKFASHMGWSLEHIAEHNVKKIAYRNEMGIT